MPEPKLEERKQEPKIIAVAEICHFHKKAFLTCKTRKNLSKSNPNSIAIPYYKIPRISKKWDWGQRKDFLETISIDGLAGSVDDQQREAEKATFITTT